MDGQLRVVVVGHGMVGSRLVDEVARRDAQGRVAVTVLGAEPYRLRRKLHVAGTGQRQHGVPGREAQDVLERAEGVVLRAAGQREVEARIARIPDRLVQVWDEADRTGQPPADVADSIARRLIGRG